MADVLAAMVVSPLVSMVKEKASSYLLEQYKVMEGLEKQHKLLKRKLPAILDVIADAEEQAAAKREGAKAWLEEVREVAYKANDVLDEFKYEALRRKAKKEEHYKELGMDVIKLFPSHNRVVFRHRMGNKLCIILQELDVLITEMNAFGFKFQPGPSVPVSHLRANSSDISDDRMKQIASESRAKEKQKIVEKFLEASNVNLTIFPIVGMGGMGKTTLAQLVYNDPDIQKHFQLRLWVCVSDDFDVDSLARKIVEENSCNKESGKSALDNLQNAVSGKRYLLVMDDVWNRDEPHKWKKLKSYLQHGGSGSVVLTTTRDQTVAKLMMDTDDKAYELGNLDDDAIAEIIKTRAFCSKQEKDGPCDLVSMVGDFVKRCAGSPLAATALGSVLSTKTTVDEWKVVLERKKICDEENRILPVLKLSYNCLPSYMRQCFAFCAMFPKDYEINVENLIQLWMANGFIPEKEGVHPEIFGKNIFVELASRSFFQDVKGIPFEFTDIEDPRVTCKIHDLMHDVALDSMGKECAAIQSKSRDFPHSASHLLLSVDEPETFLNASLKKGSPVIQTLICEENVGKDLQHLSKYSSTRALRIRGCSMSAAFLKPRCLHHLRYLDLSNSAIRSLPEDISVLYHLQTLNLYGCKRLEGLPKGMKYMTALRHLYTHGCEELKSMPAGLRHLTSLQTLTCFVACDSSSCSNVGELEQLDDLGGDLELGQLENVKVADAKAAKLKNKKKLARLTLRWTDGYEEAGNSDKEVLECLKPYDGLKVLNIFSYNGNTCPTWMNKLQGIVKLELSDCKKLEKLPTVWHLPDLRVLCLDRLPNFKTWWDTNEVDGENLIFPRLEKLSIKGCESLGALPKASVINPPSGGVKAECRPAFLALRELELMDLATLERWEAGEETLEEHIIFPHLEKLSIKNCERLAALPKASVINLSFGGVETECRSAFPALRELELVGLATLERWEAGEGTLEEQIIFPQLEKLSIRICKSLAALPKAFVINLSVGGVETECRSAFPALRELELRDLATFEKWEAGQGTSGEELTFPQLGTLRVWDCPKVTSLPEALKLSVFEVGKVSQKILSQLAASRHIDSLSSLMLLSDVQETESVAEQTSCDELVHGKEKWDHGSPLTRMELQSYNLFSSAVALWTCFAQLVDLTILGSCDALVHWPEKEFQALVSLRTLFISHCHQLTGRTQEASELSASERSRLLPRLESLDIYYCHSLVEVPNLPKSLKTLCISLCKKLESIVFGQQEDMPSSAFLESLQIFCCSVSKVANLPPSIKDLDICGCNNIGSLSGQLDALQTLNIRYCSKLKSVESFSGRLPSLEALYLRGSSSLQSLPNGPQAYSSLRVLGIQDCFGIEPLPLSLQQRLDRLEEKELDARYEGWQYATRRRLACLKQQTKDLTKVITKCAQDGCGSCVTR